MTSTRDPYCMTHRERCYTAAHDYDTARHHYAPADAARVNRYEAAMLAAAAGAAPGPEVVKAACRTGAVVPRSILIRLGLRGLIEVHPEWSGLFRTTPAGLDALEAYEARVDEEASFTEGCRQFGY